jgi:hypothetical protein
MSAHTDSGAVGAPDLRGEEVAAGRVPQLPAVTAARAFDCYLPGHRVRVETDSAVNAANTVFEAHGTWPFEVVEVVR